MSALPPLCAVLPRTGRRRHGLCAACWSQALVHRAALLRAARHSVPLRSRSRRAVDGGDRRSAGLSARARGGALRRRRPHARACAQIRRPARPCAHAWAAGWRAPAANCSPRPTRIVPVPLHWRRLWARRFNQSALLAEIIAKAAACRSPMARSSACKATPQQVGLSPVRARRQRAGRVPRAAGGKAAVAGRRLDPGRRCAHLRRHRRRLRPGAAARRRRAGRCAGIRPGCGGGPRPHIKCVEANRREHPWLTSKSTPPAIAPIASRPRSC